MTSKLQYGPVWRVEEQVPNTTIWSLLSIAGDVGMPNCVTMGSWSSGTPDGTITATIVGVHDSSSPKAAQWPLYIEGWTLKGSHENGTVFNEIAMINMRGSCSDITPYHIGAAGQINALRLGVGKPPEGGGEISAFITMLNVEGTMRSVARLGMVVADGALKIVNGIGRALNFARNHAIVWWDQWGRETSVIKGTTVGAEHKVSIELGNGAIHFAGPDGVNQFSFNCSTGAFYMGSGAIGPNGTIRMFVAGRAYLLKAAPE